MARIFDNYLTTSASKYTNEVCKNERNDGIFRRFLYPRWESNPDLRFRKPPFYPLNYKGLRLFCIAWRKGRACFRENFTARPAPRFRKPSFYPLNYGAV